MLLSQVKTKRFPTLLTGILEKNENKNVFIWQHFHQHLEITVARYKNNIEPFSYEHVCK